MSTHGFTNPELATIAVSQLGGDSRIVDKEDVAIYANSIAPGRFSWRKYPEFIDLGSVRDALNDAKKQRYGGLLVGDNKKGWMLSPSGVKWISTIDVASLNRDELSKNRRNSISENQEIEAARLRATRACQLFVSGRTEQITTQDFFQFTRINEYFQTKTREKRYARVENAVVGDETLLAVWTMLKRKFAEEIK